MFLQKRSPVVRFIFFLVLNTVLFCAMYKHTGSSWKRKHASTDNTLAEETSSVTNTVEEESDTSDPELPESIRSANEPQLNKKLSDKSSNSKDSEPKNSKPNVLFLVADDLRPQMNAYKSLYPSSGFVMHTPNLDKLASKSLLFSQAYVQYSLCAPSRASYMTSRRPDTTKIWNLESYWRESGGNFTTIPQFFKQRGYNSIGVGKIYHGGKAGGFGDRTSWSKKWYHAPYKYGDPSRSWRAITKSERKEQPLMDDYIRETAINELRDLKEQYNNGTPFFLAVGFSKPHLPFAFPEEYLDFYPIENIPLPVYRYLPHNFPKAYRVSVELHNYDDGALYPDANDNITIPVRDTKVLTRAYFAAVSYIDDLLGDILAELAQLGLSDSTIVSFVGDHGFHLGENNVWAKQTNFDRGLHAPMMIHVPGKTDNGLRSSSLVEFVDLFPTLVELTGFEALPVCPPISSDIELCTEGESLVPLFNQPDMELKSAAFSQFKRGPYVMEYTIRTQRYRYNHMVRAKFTDAPEGRFDLRYDWNKTVSAQLYDHLHDPEETTNIAEDPEVESVVLEMTDRLHTMFGDTIKSVEKSYFN